jgi:hypothetical protein
MDLIRKAFARCGLLLLLAGIYCGAAHAGPLRTSCVVPFTQQQPTEQTPAANDSAQQGSAADADQGPNLNDQVAHDVLQPLSVGMQSQNLQLILSVFDKKELASYSDLQGELRAFFQQFSQINFRYQVLQTTADGDHGSATADLSMDAVPYELSQISSRRNVQMRFQLKREAKGWKITGFTPADFFAVDYNRTGVR